MTRLEFKFQDFIDEIDALSSFAQRFIAKDSWFVLPQFKEFLQLVRGAESGRVFEWKIDERSPLRTKDSLGEYEPNDRRGKHEVFAEITSSWQIEPLGPHNASVLPGRKFALVGKASTRVRIFKKSPEGKKEIAMWRMEIASGNKPPGCYFHVQILGEIDESPFPHSLSVPRFPTFFATPTVVFEYVIGELFQDDWGQEAVRETGPLKRWRSIQLLRLKKQMEWQISMLNNTTGSPWAILKALQPESNLFL